MNFYPGLLESYLCIATETKQHLTNSALAECLNGNQNQGRWTRRCSVHSGRPVRIAALEFDDNKGGVHCIIIYVGIVPRLRGSCHRLDWSSGCPCAKLFRISTFKTNTLILFRIFFFPYTKHMRCGHFTRCLPYYLYLFPSDSVTKGLFVSMGIGTRD